MPSKPAACPTSKLVSAFLMDERMTGMEREKAEIDVVQGLY